MRSICGICKKPLDRFYINYPAPVCPDCDKKALNSKGDIPRYDSLHDHGDNPVFIDGKKCWRRYRFGVYMTMLDRYDCETIEEFYKRSARDHFKIKPSKCPNCGTKKVVPILYGMHTLEAKEMADEGKTYLGGRSEEIDGPMWKCLRCGKDLFKISKDE